MPEIGDKDLTPSAVFEFYRSIANYHVVKRFTEFLVKPTLTPPLYASWLVGNGHLAERK